MSHHLPIVGLGAAVALVATLPTWITDMGAVAAVVVSMAASAAAIVRYVRQGLAALGDRFVEEARRDLAIDELTASVDELHVLVRQILETKNGDT